MRTQWTTKGRRFFLLMRSRTPPISSEFRGGGGLNAPNPPSRYATGYLRLYKDASFLILSSLLVTYSELFKAALNHEQIVVTHSKITEELVSHCCIAVLCRFCCSRGMYGVSRNRHVVFDSWAMYHSPSLTLLLHYAL